MPRQPLDYHSTDLGAVAPDETLIWSGETDRKRGGCAAAAKIVLFAVGAVPVITVFIWLVVPAKAAGVATAIILSLAGGFVALTLLDVVRSRSLTPKQVRFTDRRLVIAGVRPADFRQLSHDQLKSFKAVVLPQVGVREVSVGSSGPDEDEATDLYDAEVEEIPLHVATPAARDLIAEMAARGIAARVAKRQWRREWRPAKIEALPALPLSSVASTAVVQSPELLSGEAVVWSGRPVLRWRADLLARLIAVGRSAGWILAGAGLVTCAMLDRDHANGGLITLGVIGGLILFGQFVAHVWAPIFQGLRLRKTSYVLTTHRLIVATTDSTGTQISSTIFDDATEISLELLRDGRGSIVVGLRHRLERIDSAAAVYTLALRALAGWREGSKDSALSTAPTMGERVTANAPIVHEG